ncbi:tetratricopeptide repeat protein [Aestuariirhabdus sp. LZHN29]|uniref:tetratricopeptide repeat protein n=1 Tax=Aestuariirhabdus sp. LZHN29 TaxID=3417462 RepID=UPI003CF5B1C8
MVRRGVIAFIVSVAFVSTAMAAGSSSSSTQRKSVDYEMGIQAIKVAHYEKALSLFGSVVEAEPDNADAWNYIGFSNRKLYRYGDALGAYNKALAIDPDHRGANEYLGELYLQTDELEKARERLNRLDDICTFGCEEFDDLKAAIEAYEIR